MQSKIDEQNRIIESAQQVISEKETIVESKNRELKIIKESAERSKMLGEMLKPLNQDKASVMTELLENVQTDKLQFAFEKYLPAVLNNSVAKNTAEKAVLNESRKEVTGDKTSNAQQDDTKVIELRRLAGLR